MTTTKKPYKIINTNNTTHPEASIRRMSLPALNELNMPEIKLLTFYWHCDNGFTPAAKYIQSMTGLIPTHMYNARCSLIEKHYVNVDDKKHTLTVNWDAMIKDSIAITSLRMCEQDVKEKTGKSASDLYAEGVHAYDDELHHVCKAKKKKKKKDPNREYGDRVEKFVNTMGAVLNQDDAEVERAFVTAFRRHFNSDLPDEVILGVYRDQHRIAHSERTAPPAWADLMKNIIDLNTPEPASMWGDAPLPF